MKGILIKKDCRDFGLEGKAEGKSVTVSGTGTLTPFGTRNVIVGK